MKIDPFLGVSSGGARRDIEDSVMRTKKTMFKENLEFCYFTITFRN